MVWRCSAAVTVTGRCRCGSWLRSPLNNSDTPPAAHPRPLAPPTTLTCQRHASLSRAARGTTAAPRQAHRPLFNGLLGRLQARPLDVEVRDDLLDALGHPPGALAEQGHHGRH